MFNFKEEDYFKEFTDEYAEYNSKFKFLTDYQKEEITKKIYELSERIINDEDNFEKNSIKINVALATAKDWLRWDGSNAFKDVLIYRGVLMNLKEYKKLNLKSDNTEETDLKVCKKVKDLTVEELIMLGKQNNIRNLRISIQDPDTENKHWDVHIGGTFYGRELFLDDEVEIPSKDKSE